MQIREKENTGLSEMRPLFGMHAELCKALASEHRLAILYSLKEGERCVSDVAAEVDISVHNVSQHLRILKQRLLVRSRKEGQTVYYSITNPKFVQACTLIRQALIEEHQAEDQTLRAAGLLDEASQGSHPGQDRGQRLSTDVSTNTSQQGEQR